jgi:hypothetical protein
VMATGPGHVWSWDITELYPPWRGRSFKAYSVRDIYSRQMVAWRVEEREADHLAVDMCETALHGVPRIVHADSGPAMRSHLLRNALTSHGVELSHNRPYISNDNPFSESGLRAPGSGLRAPGSGIQARLPPRVQRTRCRQGLPCRLRALVQHPTQTHWHRPVLTR